MDLTSVELLFGHTDEDSAFLVDDYPYGFRARTQIRYWLESKPKHGDRFVSQTLNPKTGNWNKPKRSTYTSVGVMYLDESDHVKWTGLGTWPDKDWLAHFVGTIGLDPLTDVQRANLAQVIGQARAFEHVTFTVRESSGPDPEADAEQERIWKQVQKLVAIETHKAKQRLEG